MQKLTSFMLILGLFLLKLVGKYSISNAVAVANAESELTLC